MSKAGGAAATDPLAQAAAASALTSGGGAVDALIAGFFAAAAARRDVLLSPAAALTVGHSGGVRCFDGRYVQPGRGAPRPRGYLAGTDIPQAARVPVPRAVGMLHLLHSYGGRARLRELIRPAVSAAQRASAPRRAEIIGAIADRGLLGIRSRDVTRALLEVGGQIAGGTLTEIDLDEARPNEDQAQETNFGSAAVVTAPWSAESTSPIFAAGSHEGCEIIVARDHWAACAALVYVPTADGLAIDPLELQIAPHATPVQRHVPRVAPGTPLPMPFPAGLVHTPSGFTAAIGFPTVAGVPLDAWSALVTAEIPFEPALHAVCAQNGFARALAVFGSASTRAIHINTA